MMNGISSSMSSWASSLFAKLDTKSQGYIEKTDLQNAFSSLSSQSSTSVDDVFTALDSDSDGKVTESELSSTLSKLASELDGQFNQMRMRGFGGHHGQGGGMSGMGGMPPPSQGGDDAGFTKDELSSQLEEIGSSDSKRSSLISKIVDNFDAADSNGDGKVSRQEAMTFDQSSKTSSTSSTSSTGTSASDSDLARLMAALGGVMGQGQMPPPPSGSDQGFSKDDLTSQLKEIGSSDSRRSSLISSLIENFSTADTNSDGKITGSEARAFDQSQGTTSKSDAAAGSEIQVMLKMMQLMQAYGIQGNAASTTSTTAVTA